MIPADLLRKCATFDIVSELELSPRAEKLMAIPKAYSSTVMRGWLRAMTKGAKQLRTHQALALDALEMGSNVVTSTGTASGKSLVHQAAIVKMLLSSDGVALMLQPMKALAGDQFLHMRNALDLAGLDPGLLVEINGDVPTSARGVLLEQARVIVATPDVIHAWLMRQVGTPAGKLFLRRLRLLVIDEAHVYEGEFGSHAAYLFRRLRSAQQRAEGGAPANKPPLQIIAATATIASPAEHLQKLTGAAFVSVGEEHNGAPCHPRSLLHIDGLDHGAPAERMIADILRDLCPTLGDHRFIAFHDSRQGVERITRAIGREDVLPYRSGYEAPDRRRIEDALRAGTLKGVVTTSALEAGIDIKHFVLGFNIGVPQSRKSFLQRLGRVGRSGPGLFAIIAPPHAFTQFGSSLQDFYDGAVEPSHLYLENQYVQFAQARCLHDECEAVDGASVLPPLVEWPVGFNRVFEIARPGTPRPRDFEAIAALGGNSPHHNYPLRNACETTYALRDVGASSISFGTIGLHQAVREAYPGATYLHLKQPRKVRGWRSDIYDRAIRMETVRHAAPTLPLLRKQVNVSCEPLEVISGHLLRSAGSFLVEATLQVNESVEGFRSGSVTHLYKDLRKKDPLMERQQRDFSTTGVVLRIDAPWFTGAGAQQVKARELVARGLRLALMREHSIAPGDVDAADAGIALYSPSGPMRLDNAVAIYDSAAGGLRLTTPLFTDLGKFVGRLMHGATLAGDDALLPQSTAVHLAQWLNDLGKPQVLEPEGAVELGEGEYVVFQPDSEVSINVRGRLVERRLLEPQLISMAEDEVLMYRYEAHPGVTAWVAHHLVRGTGQQWRKVVWNAETGAMRSLEA